MNGDIAERNSYWLSLKRFLPVNVSNDFLADYRHITCLHSASQRFCFSYIYFLFLNAQHFDSSRFVKFIDIFYECSREFGLEDSDVSVIDMHFLFQLTYTIS